MGFGVSKLVDVFRSNFPGYRYFGIRQLAGVSRL